MINVIHYFKYSAITFKKYMKSLKNYKTHIHVCVKERDRRILVILVNNDITHILAGQKPQSGNSVFQCIGTLVHH